MLWRWNTHSTLDMHNRHIRTLQNPHQEPCVDVLCLGNALQWFTLFPEHEQQCTRLKTWADSSRLALGTRRSPGLAASRGSELVVLPTRQFCGGSVTTPMSATEQSALAHALPPPPPPPHLHPRCLSCALRCTHISIMNSKVDFTTSLPPHKTKCQNKSCHN